jgi:hypothetical protein
MQDKERRVETAVFLGSAVSNRRSLMGEHSTFACRDYTPL